MARLTRIPTALLTLMLSAAPQTTPPRAPVAAVAPLTHAQVTHDRAEICHGLHVPDLQGPDKPPALHAELWSSFSPMPGVIADRVTYSTADGMLVPAIVYRPTPEALKAAHVHGKLPAIVIVNGHGADKFSWYAFYSGLLFARAGAVVLTYDPIGEGERNARKHSRDSPSPHDVYPPTPAGMSEGAWHQEWGPHVAGLMQVDLLQAVSYLDAQPEVDRGRIAVAGYSMGSFIAGIEGAYDTRVHAVLLSGGGTYDGPGQYFDSSKLPCQGPPYRALMVLRKGVNEPDARGAVLFALNAHRGPLLVMNGDIDRVMDIPHHNAAWFAALHEQALALVANDPAAQRNMFTNIFVPGAGHRPSWVTLPGAEWLDQQLHFAFWPTEADLEAAGHTHISTWIRANDVSISKNYLVEQREGGIDAVGTGFPAIPRADLMVLPDSAWEQLKDHLTFAAWEKKTEATLAR